MVDEKRLMHKAPWPGEMGQGVLFCFVLAQFGGQDNRILMEKAIDAGKLP